MFVYYYTVCYFTSISYAVVRHISVLFVDNKDSAFCILSYPHMLKIIDLPFSSMKKKIEINILSNWSDRKRQSFVCLFVCLFVCFFVVILVFLGFVASDVLTTICHHAIVNVCVIIILSIGNTQICILLLCFLYLFVELMITMNE